jgi:hypothetical protein
MSVYFEDILLSYIFCVGETNMWVHDLMPTGFLGILNRSACRMFQTDDTFVKRILLNVITASICAGQIKNNL